MIKDLPTLDKPREKAIYYGVDRLSDAELIAILIRTGTKNKSSLDIAYQVIKNIGNLEDISVVSVEKLSKIKGLGITKAITILSALELGKRFLKKEAHKNKITNSKEIFNTFKYYFYNKKQEIFMIVFLDLNRKIISSKEIYKGTIDTLNVNHNEIFKEAILHTSSNIIIIHNHPSGSIYPSNEDIMTTKKIKKLGNILNINLLDHIIITNDNYYSFLDNGDL